MKKIVFALAALCSITSSMMMAQDEAELATGMKQLAKEMGMVRKADPKTGPEVAAAADRIAGIYDVSKAFWTKRGGAEDAVKWSDEGKTIAMEASEAAKAGDAAKAGSAFQKLNGTCKSCHEAHRERTPDGMYKIK